MKKNVFCLLIFIIQGVGLKAQEIEIFPQMGHSESVSSVVISYDGKYTLSGSYDGTLKLWDIKNGRELRTFNGHTKRVSSVAISPDGKYALSSSYDNTVKLWDISNGEEIITFRGHTSLVRSVCFTPEGKYILSGSSDRSLKLWDIATGEIIRTFNGHTKSVGSIAISPDGKYALSGSDDSTLKLWNITTSDMIITFNGHAEEITSVAISHDGKYVISSSRDGSIKLWNLVTGKLIRTFLGSTNISVTSVAFSPDGKYVLSGSYDETIRMWDIDSGREIRTFKGHTSTVNCVTFSLEGKYALSGSSDKSLKLWDIATGREIQTFSGHSKEMISIAFSPDGKYILSGSQDKSLKLWDVTTGSEVRIFTGHRIIISYVIRSIAINSDGKYALTGSEDRTLKLWDIATGEAIRTFSGHDFEINSVAISPDGKYALSGSRDRTLILWDIAKGSKIRDFQGHTEQVRSVAISPDGKHVLSGSDDGTIKIWNIETGQEIKTFEGHNAIDFSFSVRSISFCPNGKYALSSSYDRTLKLWDIDTGEEIRTFRGHTSFVRSACFSPDGKYALSCSDDNTLKLWNIETGQEIRTFEGHTNKINLAVFNPNGKHALSVSDDCTVRLWDVATGKEIAKFISFSGSDSQLVTNTRSVIQDAADKIADISGEWIVITPDGYYAASPMGDRYLNVRVGNRVTGIDSFRHIFYNPDVVYARLNGLPDPESKKAITIQEAMSIFPSTITLQTPSTSTTGTANLAVTVVDDNQPLQNIKILVNGRLVGKDELAGLTGAQGLVPERASITVTEDQTNVSFNIPLALDPGNNLIEVIALNRANTESRQKTTLTWQTSEDFTPELPNLWILAVGVNSYSNVNINKLNYAANDAREIVNTFKTQEGKRYAKVNSLVVADGEALEPTTENIRESLSFLEQAGPRDTILLFLAGHGVNGKDGMFEFLPRDTIVNADETFSNVITGDEINAVLNSPGNRLIFIDACHSGSVDNDRMIRQFMNTNAFVFASCRGNEFSHELALYRHGVFTYSILETIRGSRGERTLSVIDLSGTVSLDVPRRVIRWGQQNPAAYSLGFYDFIIGE